MRTCTKANADDMIAGEVNHGDTFSLRIHRTDVGVVKVDGKAEALESDIFKEITIPQLESSQ